MLAAEPLPRRCSARRKYSGTKEGVDRWRSEAYNRPVTTTLFQVDDDARLFISPVIEDWAIAAEHEINVVIDLEGGLDQCIPTMPGSCLYVYFPIFDEELPDPARLDAVTMMGAHLVRTGTPGAVALRHGLQPLGPDRRADPASARDGRP